MLVDYQADLVFLAEHRFSPDYSRRSGPLTAKTEKIGRDHFVEMLAVEVMLVPGLIDDRSTDVRGIFW